MLIERLDRSRCHHAYGILCQGLEVLGEAVDAPFSASWALIPPAGVARAHKHQEHEAFLIARGRGTMVVDGETREVGPGDAVVMEPFSVHELRNLSAEDDLLFLDLLWERLPEAAGRNHEMVANAGEAAPKATLVTATPPTPNGDLHVGHLSGPYLGADVHARYLRLRGTEARYLSGVDDHQSYVEVKAAAEVSEPEAVARHYGDVMERTLSGAAMDLAHFARPRRSPVHAPLVRKFFSRLLEQGAIEERDAPTLYCERCDRFLFEAHVRATCPRCGSGCDGNVCESCGWPNDGVDLVAPRCRACGEPAAVRTCRRLYFPLAPWARRLSEYYQRVQMGPHLRSLCEEMLREGMPEIAISQVGEWGIPVPMEGYETQRLFVWFEMAPGYLAATQELADRLGLPGGWERIWCSDDHRVVQFFGFDNGYFHAVLFPALYLAYGPEIRLPAAFVTNEFYRYEGTKFSTSRGHALWGHELLERVPADIARFYLALDRPETEQRDFWLHELEETVQRELVGEWETWLLDLGRRLREESGGTVPGTGAWTEEHQRYYHDLLETIRDVGEAYGEQRFSLQRAARRLSELVRRAQAFGCAEQHWRKLPDRYEEWRTAVALEVLTAKCLAMMASPLMPGFAARLWGELGLDGEGGAPAWEDVPDFVPAGRGIRGMEAPYFERLAKEPGVLPAGRRRAS